MDDAAAPDRLGAGRLLARVAWIVIQLVAVLYFGQQGSLFFYQFF